MTRCSRLVAPSLSGLNNNVSSSGLKPVGDVLDGILAVAFPLSSFFVEVLGVEHNTAIVRVRLVVLRTIDIRESQEIPARRHSDVEYPPRPQLASTFFALPEVGKFLL